MNLILYAILGTILVLGAAFLSLWFVTKKKRPNQGVVSQIASGISESAQLGNVPPATPVEVVTPNPQAIAPIIAQAYDPVTGVKMLAPPIPQPIGVAQVVPAEKVEEVNKKIDKLNKKIDEVKNKVQTLTP